MSLVDIIIVGVVVILFVGALIYIRRNGTCTEDCSSCHGACTAHKKQKKNPGDVPDFVKAYRKDHPKQDHPAV